MINPKDLIKELKKNNIDFYTGVPDSVLKNLSPHFDKNKKKHITAVNEGNAVGLAVGYHLATKKLACVYMQNSGLGNAINPLVSIAHTKVYSIPMLLLIGWRGSPNSKDEPQHNVKGKITKKLLSLLGINFCVIKNKSDLIKLRLLIKSAKKNNKPIACLIQNKVLEKVKEKKFISKKRSLPFRKEIIKELIKNLTYNANIIATTGFASRELMELRKKVKLKGNDFYMVGGMGHSSSVALGISLNSSKKTICLDGDGSLLMHFGSLVTSGFFAKKNFKHLLLNNYSHESVGGQRTNIEKVKFKDLTKAVGYKKYILLKNRKEIYSKVKLFLKSSGPVFCEASILQGSDKNLMRPKSLHKIKEVFMKNV